MIDSIKDFVKDALAKATGTIVSIGTGGRVSIGGTASGGPIIVDPSANMRLGRNLAAQLGWDSGLNWSNLVSLWNQESGWSNIADTRVSGLDPAGAAEYAYGIAQARPASKYPKPGQPPDMGGSADPASQIAWGLNYIAGRYGSPSGAWAHELQYNWYDQGGLLPAGASLVYNGTGQAELVAPRETFDQLMANRGNDNGPTFVMPITQHPRESGIELAERVSSRVDFKLRARGGSR
jgi:hypothetical protein